MTCSVGPARTQLRLHGRPGQETRQHRICLNNRYWMAAAQPRGATPRTTQRLALVLRPGAVQAVHSRQESGSGRGGAQSLLALVWG